MGDEGLREQLLRIGEELLASFTNVAPKLLVALVLLLVGLILSALAQRITRSALRRARIRRLLAHLGLAQRAEPLDVESKLVDGIARTVFFLVLILFAQSAIDVLGLTTVSEAVSAVLGYVPRILGAIAIMILGVLLAKFVGAAVEKIAVDGGIGHARLFRQGATALIIFTVLVMATSQLEVDTEMVRSLARIALGGVALGTAITFGFGTRDATRNLVAGFYLRKLIRPGERIEVQGVVGTLVAVTHVQTVIDRGAGEVKIVANSLLLRDFTKR